MSKGTAICKFSTRSTRGYVTEINGSVGFRANIQDVPASYRVDRFDDLPDFPILVDNRRSDRKAMSADNLF